MNFRTLPIVTAVASCIAFPLPAQIKTLADLPQVGLSGEVEARSYILDKRKTASPVEDEAVRILGGRVAKPAAWPSAASLHDPSKMEGGAGGNFPSLFCSASIIAREWILTAAHCVSAPDGRVTAPEDVLVRTSSGDVTKGDMRKVARVIVHENFTYAKLDHDLALLELEEPIERASGPVGAIKIVQQGFKVPEGPATVAGWGMVEDGKFPKNLVETDVEIVANEVCNEAIDEQARQDIGTYLTKTGAMNNIPPEQLEGAFQTLVRRMGPAVSENVICASLSTEMRASCTGNGGAGLMVKGIEDEWFQVGIASWGREPVTEGERCGYEELFASYTRLSNYFDWIAGHVLKEE